MCDKGYAMNPTGCPKIGEAFIEACVNDADTSKVSDGVCNIMCENYTHTYIPVAKAGYIDSTDNVALKDLECHRYFIGEISRLHEFTNEQYLREKANETLRLLAQG